MELQRTFDLMKELDRQSEGTHHAPHTDEKAEIDVLWKQYCAARHCGPLAAEALAEVKQEGARDDAGGSAHSTAAEAAGSSEAAADAAAGRHDLLLRLSTRAQSTVSIGDEKLALAVAAYDSVDRHIRRLDADLLKNERSLHAGLREELAGKSAGDGTTTALPLARDRFSPDGQLLTFWSGLVHLDTLTCLAYLKEHLGKEAAAADARPAKGRHKRTASQQSASNAEPAGMTRFAETEVDPSEPRYCYCDRVSYGEMVACDNDDCPREWVRFLRSHQFHYACVGLEHPPKGHWYCQFCAPPHWKGPGTRVPDDAPIRPPKRVATRA